MLRTFSRIKRICVYVHDSVELLFVNVNTFSMIVQMQWHLNEIWSSIHTAILLSMCDTP